MKAAEYMRGRWSKGPVEWDAGETVYISIVFTWDLDKALARAIFWKAIGKRVVVGGPALFLKKMREEINQPLEHEIEQFVEIGGVWDMPDAVVRHNPMATNASYGCPVGCWWCIVPAMHGKTFTLAPEFTPRPVLCDNNLSALPVGYQQYIIEKYLKFKVPLLDANSGFEPARFDEDTFKRWKVINRGPWRFAYDVTQRREDVYRVTRILKDEAQRRKIVYVMIGHESFDQCMERIREVIGWGCEPHVQPFIKLNALQKRPHVRHDWTERRLQDVARWADGRYWKYTDFAGYNRSIRTARRPIDQERLFA